jgi:hypothetical protein
VPLSSRGIVATALLAPVIFDSSDIADLRLTLVQGAKTGQDFSCIPRLVTTVCTASKGDHDEQDGHDNYAGIWDPAELRSHASADYRIDSDCL